MNKSNKCPEQFEFNRLPMVAKEKIYIPVFISIAPLTIDCSMSSTCRSYSSKRLISALNSESIGSVSTNSCQYVRVFALICRRYTIYSDLQGNLKA